MGAGSDEISLNVPSVSTVLDRFFSREGNKDKVVLTINLIPDKPSEAVVKTEVTPEGEDIIAKGYQGAYEARASFRVGRGGELGGKLVESIAYMAGVKSCYASSLSEHIELDKVESFSVSFNPTCTKSLADTFTVQGVVRMGNLDEASKTELIGRPINHRQISALQEIKGLDNKAEFATSRGRLVDSIHKQIGGDRAEIEKDVDAAFSSEGASAAVDTVLDSYIADLEKAGTIGDHCNVSDSVMVTVTLFTAHKAGENSKHASFLITTETGKQTMSNRDGEGTVARFMQVKTDEIGVFASWFSGTGWWAHEEATGVAKYNSMGLVLEGSTKEFGHWTSFYIVEKDGELFAQGVEGVHMGETKAVSARHIGGAFSNKVNIRGDFHDTFWSGWMGWGEGGTSDVNKTYNFDIANGISALEVSDSRMEGLAEAAANMISGPARKLKEAWDGSSALGKAGIVVATVVVVAALCAAIFFSGGMVLAPMAGAGTFTALGVTFTATTFTVAGTVFTAGAIIGAKAALITCAAILTFASLTIYMASKIANSSIKAANDFFDEHQGVKLIMGLSVDVAMIFATWGIGGALQAAGTRMAAGFVVGMAKAAVAISTRVASAVGTIAANVPRFFSAMAHVITIAAGEVGVVIVNVVATAARFVAQAAVEVGVAFMNVAVRPLLAVAAKMAEIGGAIGTWCITTAKALGSRIASTGTWKAIAGWAGPKLAVVGGWCANVAKTLPLSGLKGANMTGGQAAKMMLLRGINPVYIMGEGFRIGITLQFSLHFATTLLKPLIVSMTGFGSVEEAMLAGGGVFTWIAKEMAMMAHGLSSHDSGLASIASTWSTPEGAGMQIIFILTFSIFNIVPAFTSHTLGTICRGVAGSVGGAIGGFVGRVGGITGLVGGSMGPAILATGTTIIKGIVTAVKFVGGKLWNMQVRGASVGSWVAAGARAFAKGFAKVSRGTWDALDRSGFFEEVLWEPFIGNTILVFMPESAREFGAELVDISFGKGGGRVSIRTQIRAAIQGANLSDVATRSALSDLGVSLQEAEAIQRGEAFDEVGVSVDVDVSSCLANAAEALGRLNMEDGATVANLLQVGGLYQAATAVHEVAGNDANSALITAIQGNDTVALMGMGLSREQATDPALLAGLSYLAHTGPVAANAAGMQNAVQVVEAANANFEGMSWAEGLSAATLNMVKMTVMDNAETVDMANPGTAFAHLVIGALFECGESQGVIEGAFEAFGVNGIGYMTGSFRSSNGRFAGSLSTAVFSSPQTMKIIGQAIINASGTFMIGGLQHHMDRFVTGACIATGANNSWLGQIGVDLVALGNLTAQERAAVGSRIAFADVKTLPGRMTTRGNKGWIAHTVNGAVTQVASQDGRTQPRGTAEGNAVAQVASNGSSVTVTVAQGAQAAAGTSSYTDQSVVEVAVTPEGALRIESGSQAVQSGVVEVWVDGNRVLQGVWVDGNVVDIRDLSRVHIGVAEGQTVQVILQSDPGTFADYTPTEAEVAEATQTQTTVVTPQFEETPATASWTTTIIGGQETTTQQATPTVETPRAEMPSFDPVDYQFELPNIGAPMGPMPALEIGIPMSSADQQAVEQLAASAQAYSGSMPGATAASLTTDAQAHLAIGAQDALGGLAVQFDATQQDVPAGLAAAIGAAITSVDEITQTPQEQAAPQQVARETRIAQETTQQAIAPYAAVHSTEEIGAPQADVRLTELYESVEESGRLELTPDQTTTLAGQLTASYEVDMGAISQSTIATGAVTQATATTPTQTHTVAAPQVDGATTSLVVDHTTPDLGPDLTVFKENDGVRLTMGGQAVDIYYVSKPVLDYVARMQGVQNPGRGFAMDGVVFIQREARTDMGLLHDEVSHALGAREAGALLAAESREGARTSTAQLWEAVAHDHGRIGWNPTQYNPTGITNSTGRISNLMAAAKAEQRRGSPAAMAALLTHTGPSVVAGITIAERPSQELLNREARNITINNLDKADNKTKRREHIRFDTSNVQNQQVREYFDGVNQLLAKYEDVRTTQFQEAWDVKAEQMRSEGVSKADISEKLGEREDQLFRLREDQPTAFKQFILNPSMGQEFLTGGGKTDVFIHLYAIAGLANGRSRAVTILSDGGKLNEAYSKNQIRKDIYKAMDVTVEDLHDLNQLNDDAETERVLGAQIVFVHSQVLGFMTDSARTPGSNAARVYEALTTNTQVIQDEIHTIYGQNYIRGRGEDLHLETPVRQAIAEGSKCLTGMMETRTNDLLALVWAQHHNVDLTADEDSNQLLQQGHAFDALTTNPNVNINGARLTRWAKRNDILVQNPQGAYVRLDSLTTTTAVNGERIAPVFVDAAVTVMADYFGVTVNDLVTTENEAATPVRAALKSLARFSNEARGTNYEVHLANEETGAHIVVPMNFGEKQVNQKFSNPYDAGVKHVFGIIIAGTDLATETGQEGRLYDLGRVTVSPESTMASYHEFLAQVLKNGGDVTAMTGTFALIEGLMNNLGLSVDRTPSKLAVLKYVGIENSDALQKVAAYFDMEAGELEGAYNKSFAQFVLHDTDIHGIGHVREAFSGIQGFENSTGMHRDGNHRVITQGAGGIHHSDLVREVFDRHTGLMKGVAADSSDCIDIITHESDGNWYLHTWKGTEYVKQADPIEYETGDKANDVKNRLERSDVNQTTVITGTGDIFGLDMKTNLTQEKHGRTVRFVDIVDNKTNLTNGLQELGRASRDGALNEHEVYVLGFSEEAATVESLFDMFIQKEVDDTQQNNLDTYEKSIRQVTINKLKNMAVTLGGNERAAQAIEEVLVDIWNRSGIDQDLSNQNPVTAEEFLEQKFQECQQYLEDLLDENSEINKKTGFYNQVLAANPSANLDFTTFVEGGRGILKDGFSIDFASETTHDRANNLFLADSLTDLLERTTNVVKRDSMPVYAQHQSPTFTAAANQEVQKAQELLDTQEGQQASAYNQERAAEAYETAADIFEQAATEEGRETVADELQGKADRLHAYASHLRAQACTERGRLHLLPDDDEDARVLPSQHQAAAKQYDMAADHALEASMLLDTPDASEEDKKTVADLEKQSHMLHHNAAMQRYTACFEPNPENPDSMQMRSDVSPSVVANELAEATSALRLLDPDEEIGTVPETDEEGNVTGQKPVTAGEKAQKLAEERDRWQATVARQPYLDGHSEAMEEYFSYFDMGEDGSMQIKDLHNMEAAAGALDTAIDWLVEGGAAEVVIGDSAVPVRALAQDFTMGNDGEGKPLTVGNRIGNLKRQRDEMLARAARQPYIEQYEGSMQYYDSLFEHDADGNATTIKEGYTAQNVEEALRLGARALSNVESDFVLGYVPETDADGNVTGQKPVNAADRVQALEQGADHWFNTALRQDQLGQHQDGMDLYSSLFDKSEDGAMTLKEGATQEDVVAALDMAIEPLEELAEADADEAQRAALGQRVAMLRGRQADWQMRIDKGDEITAYHDAIGEYSSLFSPAEDGSWTIQADMTEDGTVTRTVTEKAREAAAHLGDAIEALDSISEMGEVGENYAVDADAEGNPVTVSTKRDALHRQKQNIEVQVAIDDHNVALQDYTEAMTFEQEDAQPDFARAADAMERAAVALNNVSAEEYSELTADITFGAEDNAADIGGQIDRLKASRIDALRDASNVSMTTAKQAIEKGDLDAVAEAMAETSSRVEAMKELAAELNMDEGELGIENTEAAVDAIMQPLQDLIDFQNQPLKEIAPFEQLVQFPMLAQGLLGECEKNPEAEPVAVALTSAIVNGSVSEESLVEMGGNGESLDILFTKMNETLMPAEAEDSPEIFPIVAARPVQLGTNDKKNATIVRGKDDKGIFAVTREGNIIPGEGVAMPELTFADPDERISLALIDRDENTTVITNNGNRYRMNRNGEIKQLEPIRIAPADHDLMVPSDSLMSGLRAIAVAPALGQAEKLEERAREAAAEVGAQAKETPLVTLRPIEGGIGVYGTDADEQVLVGSFGSGTNVISLDTESTCDIFRTTIREVEEDDDGKEIIGDSVMVFHDPTVARTVAGARLNAAGELEVSDARNTPESRHRTHVDASKDLDIVANSEGTFVVNSGREALLFDVNASSDSQPFVVRLASDEARYDITEKGEIEMLKGGRRMALINAENGKVTVMDRNHPEKNITVQVPRGARVTVELDTTEPGVEAVVAGISIDLSELGESEIASLKPSDRTLVLTDPETGRSVEITLPEAGSIIKVGTIELAENGSAVVPVRITLKDNSVREMRIPIVPEQEPEDKIDLAVDKVGEAIEAGEARPVAVEAQPDVAVPGRSVISSDEAEEDGLDIGPQELPGERALPDIPGATPIMTPTPMLPLSPFAEEAPADRESVSDPVAVAQKDSVAADAGVPEPVAVLAPSAPSPVSELTGEPGELASIVALATPEAVPGLESVESIVMSQGQMLGEAERLKGTVVETPEEIVDKALQEFEAEMAETGVDRSLMAYATAIRDGIIAFIKSEDEEGDAAVTEDDAKAARRLLKIQNVQSIQNCASRVLYNMLAARGEEPDRVELAREMAIVIMRDPAARTRLADLTDPGATLVSFRNIADVCGQFHEGQPDLIATRLTDEERVLAQKEGRIFVLAVASKEGMQHNDHYVTPTGIAQDPDVENRNELIDEDLLVFVTDEALQGRCRSKEAGHFDCLMFADDLKAVGASESEDLLNSTFGSRAMPVFTDTAHPASLILGIDKMWMINPAFAGIRVKAGEEAVKAKAEAEVETERLVAESLSSSTVSSYAELEGVSAEDVGAVGTITPELPVYDAEGIDTFQAQEMLDRQAEERTKLEQQAAERARLEAEADRMVDEATARAQEDQVGMDAAEQMRLDAEEEVARLGQQAAERARLEAEADRMVDEATARAQQEAGDQIVLDAAEQLRLEAEGEVTRLQQQAEEAARLERLAAARNSLKQDQKKLKGRIVEAERLGVAFDVDTAENIWQWNNEAQGRKPSQLSQEEVARLSALAGRIAAGIDASIEKARSQRREGLRRIAGRIRNLQDGANDLAESIRSGELELDEAESVLENLADEWEKFDRSFATYRDASALLAGDEAVTEVRVALNEANQALARAGDRLEDTELQQAFHQQKRAVADKIKEAESMGVRGNEEVVKKRREWEKACRKEKASRKEIRKMLGVADDVIAGLDQAIGAKAHRVEVALNRIVMDTAEFQDEANGIALEISSTEVNVAEVHGRLYAMSRTCHVYGRTLDELTDEEGNLIEEARLLGVDESVVDQAHSALDGANEAIAHASGELLRGSLASEITREGDAVTWNSGRVYALIGGHVIRCAPLAKFAGINGEVNRTIHAYINGAADNFGTFDRMATDNERVAGATEVAFGVLSGVAAERFGETGMGDLRFGSGTSGFATRTYSEMSAIINEGVGEIEDVGDERELRKAFNNLFASARMPAGNTRALISGYVQANVPGAEAGVIDRAIQLSVEGKHDAFNRFTMVYRDVAGAVDTAFNELRSATAKRFGEDPQAQLSFGRSQTGAFLAELGSGMNGVIKAEKAERDAAVTAMTRPASKTARPAAGDTIVASVDDTKVMPVPGTTPPAVTARAGEEDFGWSGEVTFDDAIELLKAGKRGRRVELPGVVNDAIINVIGPNWLRSRHERRYGVPEILVCANKEKVGKKGQPIPGPARIRTEGFVVPEEHIVVSEAEWEEISQGNVEMAAQLAHELMAAWVVQHNENHPENRFDGEVAHDLARQVEAVMLANAFIGETPKLVSATEARTQDADFRLLQQHIDSVDRMISDLTDTSQTWRQARQEADAEIERFDMVTGQERPEPGQSRFYSIIDVLEIGAASEAERTLAKRRTLAVAEIDDIERQQETLSRRMVFRHSTGELQRAFEERLALERRLELTRSEIENIEEQQEESGGQEALTLGDVLNMQRNTLRSRLRHLKQLAQGIEEELDKEVALEFEDEEEAPSIAELAEADEMATEPLRLDEEPFREAMDRLDERVEADEVRKAARRLADERPPYEDWSAAPAGDSGKDPSGRSASEIAEEITTMRLRREAATLETQARLIIEDKWNVKKPKPWADERRELALRVAGLPGEAAVMFRQAGDEKRAAGLESERDEWQARLDTEFTEERAGVARLVRQLEDKREAEEKKAREVAKLEAAAKTKADADAAAEARKILGPDEQDLDPKYVEIARNWGDLMNIADLERLLQRELSPLEFMRTYLRYIRIATKAGSKEEEEALTGDENAAPFMSVEIAEIIAKGVDEIAVSMNDPLVALRDEVANLEGKLEATKKGSAGANKLRIAAAEKHIQRKRDQLAAMEKGQEREAEEGEGGDINLADAGMDAPRHDLVNLVLDILLKGGLPEGYETGADALVLGRRVFLLGDDSVENMFDLAVKAFEAPADNAEEAIFFKARQRGIQGLTYDDIEKLKGQHGHAGILGDRVFVVRGAGRKSGRSLEDLVMHEIAELDLWQEEALGHVHLGMGRVAWKELSAELREEARDALREWMRKNPEEARRKADEMHVLADRRVAQMKEDGDRIAREMFEDVMVAVGLAMGLKEARLQHIARRTGLGLLKGDEQTGTKWMGGVVDIAVPSTPQLEVSRARCFNHMAAEVGHCLHFGFDFKARHGIDEAFDWMGQLIVACLRGKLSSKELRRLAHDAFIGRKFIEFKRGFPDEARLMEEGAFLGAMGFGAQDQAGVAAPFLLAVEAEAMRRFGLEKAGEIKEDARRDLFGRFATSKELKFQGEVVHMMGANIAMRLLGIADEEVDALIKDEDLSADRMGAIGARVLRAARLMGDALKEQDGVSVSNPEEFIATLLKREQGGDLDELPSNIRDAIERRTRRIDERIKHQDEFLVMAGTLPFEAGKERTLLPMGGGNLEKVEADVMALVNAQADGLKSHDEVMAQLVEMGNQLKKDGLLDMMGHVLKEVGMLDEFARAHPDVRDSMPPDIIVSGPQVDVAMTSADSVEFGAQARSGLADRIDAAMAEPSQQDRQAFAASVVADMGYSIMAEGELSDAVQEVVAATQGHAVTLSGLNEGGVFGGRAARRAAREELVRIVEHGDLTEKDFRGARYCGTEWLDELSGSDPELHTRIVDGFREAGIPIEAFGFVVVPDKRMTHLARKMTLNGNPENVTGLKRSDVVFIRESNSRSPETGVHEHVHKISRDFGGSMTAELTAELTTGVDYREVGDFLKSNFPGIDAEEIDRTLAWIESVSRVGGTDYSSAVKQLLVGLRVAAHVRDIGEQEVRELLSDALSEFETRVRAFEAAATPQGRLETLASVLTEAEVITGPMAGVSDINLLVDDANSLIEASGVNDMLVHIQAGEKKGAFRQFVLVRSDRDRAKLAALGLTEDHESVITYDGATPISSYLTEVALPARGIQAEELSDNCVSIAFAMNDGNRKEITAIMQNDIASSKNPASFMVVSEDEINSNTITYNLANLMTGLLAGSLSFMALGYSRRDRSLEDLLSLFRQVTGSIHVIGPEMIRDELDNIIRSLILTAKSA